MKAMSSAIWTIVTDRAGTLVGAISPKPTVASTVSA